MNSPPRFPFQVVLVIIGVMSASALAQLDYPPPARALPDRYTVMKDRSKFVELRCFAEDGQIVYDPDDIPVTVVDQPDHGTLSLFTGSTYIYIPDANSTGIDSLTFRCGPSYLNTATVTLEVVNHEFDGDTDNLYKFRMPYGLGPPDFGMMEDAPARPDPWDDPVEGYYYVDLTSGVDCPGDDPCDENKSWPYCRPASPRKTIPDALMACDVVEVATA